MIGSLVYLRFSSGVVQDLLDNAEDTDRSKILNALDFPLWDGSRDRNGYATDMAAWDVTRGLHIFDPSALYPTGDVRWGPRRAQERDNILTYRSRRLPHRKYGRCRRKGVGPFYGSVPASRNLPPISISMMDFV